MVTLQIKRRSPEPEVHRYISTLFVYDIRAGSELEPRNVSYSASAVVKPNVFGSGHLSVLAEQPQYENIDGSAGLFVAGVDDDNHVRYKRSGIRVISVEKSENLFVPAADEDKVEVEAGEDIKLTNVELDLAVSYDTYFDFKLRSIDGLRVVMDEQGKAVEMDYDSYRLRDLSPGKMTKRTVRTNNDFIVTLNIEPTIVKDSQK